MKIGLKLFNRSELTHFIIEEFPNVPNTHICIYPRQKEMYSATDCQCSVYEYRQIGLNEYCYPLKHGGTISECLNTYRELMKRFSVQQ